MKRTEIIVLTAGLLFGAGLAVIFYYGLDLGGNQTEQSDTIEGVNLPVSASVGSQAPAFELMDLDNETFSLSKMRGKIILLNFWATWCEPCKLEMPFFEQLHTSDQNDLEIWGINFDEPPQKVLDFVEEYNVSFPILLDPGGEVQDLYRVRGYPTTYVLDEDGVIRFHHIGLVTREQLDHYLDQMGAVE